MELDGGYLAWSKAHPEANATWKGMTKEVYAKLDMLSKSAEMRKRIEATKKK